MICGFPFQMNLVKYRVFMRRAELLQYFTPYSRGLWNGFEHISSVATVNAYYNQASNTMVVPIGMLQPPLFWNRPKSLTFGAFGIVVGELPNPCMLNLLKLLKTARLNREAFWNVSSDDRGMHWL